MVMIVAGGPDELVLGKLKFAADVSISAGEIMASKAAAWVLLVDLDVIILAISFPAKTKGNKRQKNRARILNHWQYISFLICKDQLITLHL